MGEDMEIELCNLLNEALEADGFGTPNEGFGVLISGNDTFRTAKLSYRDIEYELSVVNHPDGDFSLIHVPDCPDARTYQLPIDASEDYIEDTAEELYQRCKSADV